MKTGQRKKLEIGLIKLVEVKNGRRRDMERSSLTEELMEVFYLR